MPVTGTSMRYLLDEGTADEPTRKTVQYYEMMGHRALYADGWKAVTRHQSGVSFDDDTWELYHLAEDRSECHDLAGSHPEKLAELIERWWGEAEEHNVLPLDDRTIELFGARFRSRSPHPADRHYTYRPPLTALPAQVAAPLAGRSWDLSATTDRPDGADGVLFAVGNENSGLSLFVDGSPVSDRYHDEHPFAGTLARVDIQLLSPRQAEAADLAATEQRSTMARQ